MKTKLVMLLMVGLVSCSGGKKKGMLLFPLSLGDASTTSETATAGAATVTDTSQATSTGTVDSTLANVAVGETDAEAIVNPPSSSPATTTAPETTGPAESAPAATPAESSPSGSVTPAPTATTPTPAATPAVTVDTWPGETADEAETTDDPYLPVSEICEGSPTFQAVTKSNGKSDEKGKGEDKDDDKGNSSDKGKSAENKKSVSLGDFDLSMDAANCQTGRFRIALDFNIIGTLPSHTTAFQVLILDLNGKTIGKVNIQAKDQGIVKARGKITLSEVGQTILFRWDGASEKREDSVSSVAENIEITGITLYAKRSQKASHLAAMISTAGGKTKLVAASLGGTAVFILGVYALIENRKRNSLS
ncbi:MAG: hypothetical protein K8S54_21535 [Spirochaetia bacterium]|nr:hypothetical protein [Spirochaetia bacterium]